MTVILSVLAVVVLATFAIGGRAMWKHLKNQALPPEFEREPRLSAEMQLRVDYCIDLEMKSLGF